MSQRYLLDTNIISDLLRNPQGEVTRKIKELGEESICTSIIVASELRFGAIKKNSEQLSQRIDSILSVLDIIAYDVPADVHYAAIRNYLEKNGTVIGPNDMLIAAQALAQDLIVVTANTGEFSRVPDLKVENWT
jgi:tRNA(fMet)-specific endonuclease VapC